MIKSIIKTIFCLSIGLCLVACGKSTKESSNLSSDSKKAGEDALVNETYALVDVINSNSNFSEIKLLDSPSENMRVPGPELINEKGDKFYCFLYNGENRITQISLSSSDTNVLGITVGSSTSELSNKLKDYGLNQLTESEVSNIINRNHKAVDFKKAHVTLIFYVSESETDVNNATITKILIDVNNPLEEKPTY